MNIHFSEMPLVSPELQRKKVVTEFLSYNPYSSDSVRSCYAKILSSEYGRFTVSKLLLEYNERIGSDNVALDNCRQLGFSETTAVITGQQAGMFTGPLFTIYKIVTAIKLARYYARFFGTPVIPMFWNATEDHDLSEITRFKLPRREWEVGFPQTGQAAEFLKTDPFVKNLVREYISTISPINHRDEIEDLLSSEFEYYGEYSSSILAKMFRGAGLVILEPHILRKISGGFFLTCIENFRSINNRLQATGSRLGRINIRPPFEAVPERTGVFYLNANGVRNRIMERKGKFIVDKKWIAKDELVRLIHAYPERFSTSAFTRPILQSLILPTISYVAGPGEFQYHLQLRPIYELFNATMPLIHLRNHCTMLTKKEQKLAERLNLQTEDFFRGPEPFYNSVTLPERDDDKFIQAKKNIDIAATELYEALSELVTKQRFSTFRASLHYHLEKLKKKVVKEYSRRRKVDNARIDRFYRCVWPKSSPQERTLNVLYFIEIEGTDLINELIDVLNPFETRHYILFTEN